MIAMPVNGVVLNRRLHHDHIINNIIADTVISDLALHVFLCPLSFLYDRTDQNIFP